MPRASRGGSRRRRGGATWNYSEGGGVDRGGAAGARRGIIPRGGGAAAGARRGIFPWGGTATRGADDDREDRTVPDAPSDASDPVDALETDPPAPSGRCAPRGPADGRVRALGLRRAVRRRDRHRDGPRAEAAAVLRERGAEARLARERHEAADHAARRAVPEQLRRALELAAAREERDDLRLRRVRRQVPAGANPRTSRRESATPAFGETFFGGRRTLPAASSRSPEIAAALRSSRALEDRGTRRRRLRGDGVAAGARGRRRRGESPRSDGRPLGVRT